MPGEGTPEGSLLQGPDGASVRAPALSAGRHTPPAAPARSPCPSTLRTQRSSSPSASAFVQLQINPTLPLLFSVSFWFRSYDLRLYFHYTAPSGSDLLDLLNPAELFFALQPDVLNSACQLASTAVQKHTQNCYPLRLSPALKFLQALSARAPTARFLSSSEGESSICREIMGEAY